MVFQRLMEMLLADVPQFASAYMDDIIVFSTSWEKHLDHLNAVLSKLYTPSLTIKLKKCQLARLECS